MSARRGDRARGRRPAQGTAAREDRRRVMAGFRCHHPGAHLDEALPLADAIAPEHLEIVAADAERLAARIRNAGAIFIGAHTPEAIGDYVAGSNHVLPTARSARFSSGLGVLDFMKRTSILKCGPDQLRALGDAAIVARQGRRSRRPCPLGCHPAQPVMARKGSARDNTGRLTAVTLDEASHRQYQRRRRA